MQSSILRRQGASRKKAQRDTDITLADAIEEELKAEAEARRISNERSKAEAEERRISNERTKELREQKKALQGVNGIRKRRQAGKAIKGKTGNIPDGFSDEEPEDSDEENTAPPSPSKEIAPENPENGEDDFWPGTMSVEEDFELELEYIHRSELPQPSSSKSIHIPSPLRNSITPTQSNRPSPAKPVQPSSPRTPMTPADPEKLMRMRMVSRFHLPPTPTPLRRGGLPSIDEHGFIIPQLLSSPQQYN